ncbi:MAG: hypothetical protein ACO3F8_03810 [Holophagaceae bacterium]
MHLLIIDDNPSLLRALERLLIAREGWVLHCATQIADVRLALHQFEIQGVLLDHDLAEDQSKSILQMLRKNFPTIIYRTWLMHGALETAQWSADDLKNSAGILVKPQGLGQLLPWLDQLRHGHPKPFSEINLKSILEPGEVIEEEPSLKKPSSPFRELEWALKDRDAWNVEIATLLEALEEQVNIEEAQMIIDLWKRKRPIV